jgi:flagellar hook-basal body complex protein FliE
MSTRIDLLTRALPEFQTLGGDRPRGTPIDIGAGNGDGPTFGETLTDALNGVTDMQANSRDLQNRFLAGEDVDLAQVMATSSEAGLAFDLVVELRNKAVEAYRTLINMQS